MPLLTLKLRSCNEAHIFFCFGISNFCAPYLKYIQLCNEQEESSASKWHYSQWDTIDWDVCKAPINYQPCHMPPMMLHVKDKMNFDFLESSGTFEWSQWTSDNDPVASFKHFNFLLIGVLVLIVKLYTMSIILGYLKPIVELWGRSKLSILACSVAWNRFFCLLAIGLKCF